MTDTPKRGPGRPRKIQAESQMLDALAAATAAPDAIQNPSPLVVGRVEFGPAPATPTFDPVLAAQMAAETGGRVTMEDIRRAQAAATREPMPGTPAWGGPAPGVYRPDQGLAINAAGLLRAHGHEIPPVPSPEVADLIRELRHARAETEHWRMQAHRPLGNQHHDAAKCPVCTPPTRSEPA